MASQIDNRAPVGTLFKRYERQRAADPDTKGRKEDRAHLALVAKLPCIICGSEPCDAAHVRAPSAAHGKKATPLGQKPDDRWSLPLCRAKCHREQHAMPEIRFWWDAQISPVKVCIDLYRVTGNLDAMRAIIFEARK